MGLSNTVIIKIQVERKKGGRSMWGFLISVTTEVEADILIGLFEQENIPARKIYPGFGNLKATYGLISGVEIYVQSDYLLQAKAILDSTLETSFISEQDDSED